jgi:hypothetical protein
MILQKESGKLYSVWAEGLSGSKQEPVFLGTLRECRVYMRTKRAKPREIEGVTYFRYRLALRLPDGRRRERVIWSPGQPWLDSEVRRYLAAEVGEVRGNVTVRAA